ncbi:MAG: 5-formyltetrahydrofolate cyclo-ligase [Piscirickettsiaceae bacterium]|nr:MAG: 5-formyltetrahydrofolate cyclo-ligase [Piscirickettsiaceae bacterium]
MPPNTLSNLRRSLRQSRLQLPETTRQRLDSLINQNIIRSGVLLRRPNIASYMAHNGEPCVNAFINTCSRQGVRHYLPVLTKNQSLYFSRYTWGDGIRYNQFNIEEPISKNTISCRFLSAILLPLLGFDQQGNRLGMGGGYYDRTLSFSAIPSCKKSPLLIGIAYNMQEVSSITTQPWDIPLDAVITEHKISCFSKRAINMLRQP